MAAMSTASGTSAAGGASMASGRSIAAGRSKATVPEHKTFKHFAMGGEDAGVGVGQQDLFSR